MRAAGIGQGRRWLGGMLCGLSTLVNACGETSQHPSTGVSGQAGNGAGGAAATSGGGGGQAQGDGNCPTAQPMTGGACKPGQVCFYQGSTNPCAPPDATYTCVGAKWELRYASQGGVCVPEACPGGTASNCPPNVPTPGGVCGGCSAQAICPYGRVAAACIDNRWLVDRGGAEGGASGGGAGGEGGAP